MSETNGNGTADIKGTTKMQEVCAAHAVKYPKGADKKTQAEAGKAFRESHARKEKAAAEYQKALAAHSKIAEETMLVFGPKKLQFEGRTFFPSSKGDSIIYREQGKIDPDEVATI